MGLGFDLLIIPGICLGVAILFAIPLIVFARLEFWDAIKNSAKIVTKNWFYFFEMLTVLGLINLVGIFILGLGILITIPFSYAVFFSCYKDIIGIGNTERDVTDHLVDDRF